MKYIALPALCLCLMLSTKAQTLFTYGKHSVSKAEFLTAFNKNKIETNNSSQAIHDYLNLYTTFKLKVQAARDQRLDTLHQIKEDLKNFRIQVQDNYLNDEASTQSLVKEALNRSAKEMHVLHFMAPLESEPQAEKAINYIYSQLKKNRKDYENIIDESKKIAPANFGDLGYLSVFSIPYSFENTIYALHVGDISTPQKGSTGWHIFKLLNERPNQGKWKVAQILFTFPPDANSETRTAIEKKADSVYKLLQNGLPFDEAARQFSEDKLSYALGGELPVFSGGKYDTDFESHVFALKEDGSFTKPFQTPFGIHIVKRINQIPYNGADNLSLEYEIKQKVLKDNRIQSSKEKFFKQIATETERKETHAVPQDVLFTYIDTIMAEPSMKDVSRFPISNKKLISFKNKSFTGTDWLTYVRDYGINSGLNKSDNGKALWKKFVDQVTLDYYKEHLEDYNQTFAFQMKEFEDGNMLFEAMEENVWSKASLDSAGQERFYKAHAKQYVWEKSISLTSFFSADEKELNNARTMLLNGSNWRLISTDIPDVYADSSRLELSQISGIANPTEGEVSEIKKNLDGSFTFYKVWKVYPAGEIKSLEDARGSVINDYQKELEDQWVNQLRKKYPVKINDAVLTSLLK